MIRIVKDDKAIEITQGNWDNGWLKKVGWKLEVAQAPPINIEPTEDEPILVEDTKEAYVETDLTVLQEQYDAMPDKRSKEAKELKQLIQSN